MSDILGAITVIIELGMMVVALAEGVKYALKCEDDD